MQRRATVGTVTMSVSWQLERLVEIFGEEPRWFEDFYTKEEFSYYNRNLLPR